MNDAVCDARNDEQGTTAGYINTSNAQPEFTGSIFGHIIPRI